MDRVNARLFRKLLELPLGATEVECIAVIAHAKRRSPMRNTKLPIKLWRKALAIYLLHDAMGDTAKFSHAENARRLSLGNPAMLRLKRKFDALTHDQRHALRIAAHAAHAAPTGVTPGVTPDHFRALLLGTSVLTH